MSEFTFKILDPSIAQNTILKRQPLDDYSVPPIMLERLAHLFGEDITPEEAVKRILRSVREAGDAALIDWNKRIDGVELTELAVPLDQIKTAKDRIPPEVATALQISAERIRQFYEQQPVTGWLNEGLGQMIRPIERVGVYVPGGTAPLPSSLLMTAIPARVAGVKEIVVCTPPGQVGVPDIILAAAEIAGVAKVYRVGGAQAIAALAFGTESISRADKILGPGNLFVSLAKRQVFGMVGIDGLPGPTETVVIADANANPALAAADLLAQAEHDVIASAILLTPSRKFAEKVGHEVERQLATLSRREIIIESFARQSGAVVVEDLTQAFALANDYAAEHLCLLVESPETWLASVQNAGGVFMGEDSYEVLGDYVAGPSHVMPTDGTARFSSPINVWDFVKIISIVNLPQAESLRLSQNAAILANAEGLTAHAASALARLHQGAE